MSERSKLNHCGRFISDSDGNSIAVTSGDNFGTASIIAGEICQCVNSHDALVEALERCETLLAATAQFIGINPLAEEFDVHYDEADCDGACLREDCRTHLIEVRRVLKDAKVPHA